MLKILKTRGLVGKKAFNSTPFKVTVQAGSLKYMKGIRHTKLDNLSVSRKNLGGRKNCQDYKGHNFTIFWHCSCYPIYTWYFTMVFISQCLNNFSFNITLIIILPPFSLIPIHDIIFNLCFIHHIHYSVLTISDHHLFTPSFSLNILPLQSFTSSSPLSHPVLFFVFAYFLPIQFFIFLILLNFLTKFSSTFLIFCSIPYCMLLSIPCIYVSSFLSTPNMLRCIFLKILDIPYSFSFFF